jgi:poly(beta-D-mannuronate) lyase
MPGRFSRALLLLLLTGCAGNGASAEPRIVPPSQLTQTASQLRPGDVVTLADGEYKNQQLAFTARGTADQPITLRAQTPGKVIFTGKSTIAIDGEHLIVSGLLLQNGGASEDKPSDGIAVHGNYVRLTDCAVIGGTYKFLVHLYGSDIRLDHCYLAEKTSGEPTLQIEAPGEPNNDVIDHNHFGHRPQLGRNGGETMRVGYSWQSMNSSHTLVEHNLFSRCDGEIEIISSKSCDNIYRCNTFLDCGGMLTLRHGNRCIVDSNFFIAHHKRGSGCIRVIGEDHTITNNYIEGVQQGAFWITAGLVDPPLKTYFAAKNCLIAFNTVVDTAGPCLDLSAGLNTTDRTVMPQNITVANNVLRPRVDNRSADDRRDGRHEPALFRDEEGAGYTFTGNFVSSDSHSPQHVGFTAVDPNLSRAADGLLRPTADSPLRRAAGGGAFPTIRTDIDGQSRIGRYDVGCDQLSDAPITNRPLTSADVGPSWLSADKRE